MSLKERLTEDMKQAMREREAGKFRLSVIRMVLASIKNVEINERRELSQEDLLAIMSKEVKMRRDSLEEFKKADREDLAAQAQAEIDILVDYMPAQLSESEIREIVRVAVETTGASSAKDMGKVMGAASKELAGKAEGRAISDTVKRLLNV